MPKTYPGLMVGYLITIALIVLTGIVSISATKQPTASIYTGFDVQVQP